MGLGIGGNRFYHLETRERRFRMDAPVQSIGYVPVKTDWIRRSFRTINFSFILSGQGFYRREGVLCPIQAPMVLTQHPGVFVDYGPWKTWEELFLIYPRESLPSFLRTGLYSQDRPYWKIRDLPAVLEHIHRLVKRLESGQDRLKGDQVDHLLMGLLLDSHREEPSPRGTPEEVLLQEIHEALRRDPGKEYDFHGIAAAGGLSPSTFRRCWSKRYGRPPGKIQKEYRIREACRLLAETDHPVGQIARTTGYGDPLYFSRLFKNETGESPREYRLRTRSPYVPA